MRKEFESQYLILEQYLKVAKIQHHTTWIEGRDRANKSASGKRNAKFEGVAEGGKRAESAKKKASEA